MTGVESPDFGRRTLWTMHPERAEWLAAWEAAGRDLPASRVYHVEITMGDDLSELDVSDALQGIRAGRLDANGLLGWAESRAPDGCLWVQFADHGRSWTGAILYLGDEPLPARPMARSQD